MINENKKEHIVLGLTGQTGSGKTKVANRLRRLGMHVIDADKVAHRTLDTDEVIDRLVFEFGKDILNDTQNKIDRGKLGSIVFQHPDDLQKLNRITHPLIAAQIMEAVGRCQVKFILIDAPTLIESGFHKNCDFIITTTSCEEVRKKRIMKRDSISEESAVARISAQPNEFFYVEHADIVVRNDYDKEHLDMLVSHLFYYLQNIYKIHR